MGEDEVRSELDHPKNLKGDGVVAVIERGGRFLMIQRAQHLKRAGGYWCFVGGAVEAGESQQQALVREVREEVGMDVVAGEKVWQCLSFNQEWRLHCWTAIPQSPHISPNPREVADIRWMTPGEIEVWPAVLPSVIEFFKAKDLL